MLVTKLCASGGIGSVHYWPLKFERNDFSILGAIRNWRWHLDEVFVKANGETRYLWRAVDHEGEVFDALVTKKRDRKAALSLLKRLIKKYGRPALIVTDRLRSYKAALNDLNIVIPHETGRWMNNRAENSHLVFRRRERAMCHFRSASSLQKFVSIQGQVQNHFNTQRHLINRDSHRRIRSESLREWRSLAA